MDLPAIDLVRAASRRLVREWGFMGERLAGTDLPPSAVHALIEIEAGTEVTAGRLAESLRLEKSSVSRMLRKLVLAGDVAETPVAHDARIKNLALTRAGRERVAGIHAFARAQVTQAMGRLAPELHRVVLDGLRFYADALTTEPGADRPVAQVQIVAGYRTGLVARITQMHAFYYAREAGFGRRFESVVAGGLAAFCDRLDHPDNAIWAAVRGEQIVGAVAIDGQDLGPVIAHLRWFIVDDGARGGGLGRRLLDAALAFADARPFAETHLWTFGGLDAARHLYEAYGFACITERPGRQWGSEVLEQQFVRRRPECQPE